MVEILWPLYKRWIAVRDSCRENASKRVKVQRGKCAEDGNFGNTRDILLLTPFVHSLIMILLRVGAMEDNLFHPVYLASPSLIN